MKEVAQIASNLDGIRALLARWAQLGGLAAAGEPEAGLAAQIAEGIAHQTRAQRWALEIAPNLIRCQGEVVYEAPRHRRNPLAYIFFRHGVRRLSLGPDLDVADAEAILEDFVRCVAPEGADWDLTERWTRLGLEGLDWIGASALGERAVRGASEGQAVLRTVLRQIAPGGPGSHEGRIFPAAMTLQEDPFETEAFLDHEGPTVARWMQASEDRHFADEAAHLVQLLACFALRAPSPLGPNGLTLLFERLMVEIAARRDWPLFAGVCRTIGALTQLKDQLPAVVQLTLESVERALIGGPVVEALARHIDEQRDFNLWVRWYFGTSEHLEMEDVIRALDLVEGGPGRLLLKDLLHQRGMGSLERWLGRLRSGQLDEAQHLLSLLEKGGLGEEGLVLLRLALQHEHSAIRVQALRGLGRRRPPRLAESLSALLADQDAMVRREALRVLVAQGEGGVPILTERILSPEFASRPQGERRVFYEALGVLGGAEAHRMLVAQAAPVEVPWRAEDPRWPVVYGLLRLGGAGRIVVDQIERHLAGEAARWRLQQIRQACDAAPWAQPQPAPAPSPAKSSKVPQAFIDGEGLMGTGLMFNPQALIDQVVPPPKGLHRQTEGPPLLILPHLEDAEEMLFDEAVWAVDDMGQAAGPGSESEAEVSAEISREEAVADLVSDYLSELQAEVPSKPSDLSGLLRDFLKEDDD